jgi:hypothetical protein
MRTSAASRITTSCTASPSRTLRFNWPLLHVLPLSRANAWQAFWSELALREFSFKFEGDAQTFKHVMRYNFDM